MKLVVDASVVAKWLVTEVLSAEALRLLQPDNELVVPELLWAEVGNILWKKARAGELPDTEAVRRFDHLASMGLRTVSNLVVARAAVGLALATGRTVYDSIYVALAMHEGWPLDPELPSDRLPPSANIQALCALRQSAWSVDGLRPISLYVYPTIMTGDPQPATQ